MTKDKLNHLDHLDGKYSALTASLEEALVNPSVLALLRNKEQYTLYPDACDKKNGRLLLQDLKDVNNHPVS